MSARRRKLSGWGTNIYFFFYDFFRAIIVGYAKWNPVVWS